MLVTRIIAALVFAPALLVLVWLGGLPLALACLVLAALASWEVMALVIEPRGLRLWGIGLGLLVAVATLGWLPGPLLGALVPLLTMLALLFVLVRPEPIPTSVSRAALLMLGAAYGGGLITYLARLRELPDGQGLALLALFCTWASDTGAYFAGKAFGRHKLYPKISPAKTVEGAIGGIAMAVAMAFAIAAFLPTGLGTAELAVVGGLAAVLGGVGDLCESMMKRAVGAKDSSRLIPGHGGVLDRFDAVMFVAPAVYVFASFVR